MLVKIGYFVNKFIASSAKKSYSQPTIYKTTNKLLLLLIIKSDMQSEKNCLIF